MQTRHQHPRRRDHHRLTALLPGPRAGTAGTGTIPTVSKNLIAAAVASAVPQALLAATLLVGPGRQYTSLQQVAGLLDPGDTVVVDGDASYPGGVAFDRPGTPSDRIVIRGRTVNGKRPVIETAVNCVAFIDGADHYTFEGFEVRGATFRGIYHQSDDLIVRDVVVHDCNNGLMGADNGSGSLLLEFSEFSNNGSGTQAHQLYMATDESNHPGSVFRMQFCYVHDGTGGNNVKSRAERNEIYYNWIEGARYHELELIGPDPAGGVSAGLKREDSDIVGNVLWKKTTPSGGRSNFYVVRFGGDGTGESFGRYRFVNNTVIMGSSAVFRLFDGLESVEMHNNVFHRPGGGPGPLVRTTEAVWSSGEVITGRNNWVHEDLTSVPALWTGTLTGTNPLFVEFNTEDLTPSSGSALADAGTNAPPSPAGYPFPSPLFPPLHEPPRRLAPPPDSAVLRYADGQIDIGAFERLPAVHAGPDHAPPLRHALEQNFPNPFNPVTEIMFGIAGTGGSRTVASGVRLVVFDLLGREVETLVHEEKAPGIYIVRFDASGLTSGAYIYRLTVVGTGAPEGGSVFTQTKRMVLVR